MIKNIFLIVACLFFIFFLPIITFAGSGIIEVYSEPSGAKVYIDEVYVGKTPYSNPEVSTGKHHIKAFLSKDYPTQTQSVIIDAVNPQTVKFQFRKGAGGMFTGKEIEQSIEKFKGDVTFASIPTGATVIINNGEKKTTTPKGFTGVEVGKYTVEFKLNGKSLKGEFDVIKDETVKLIADFDKSKIKISINDDLVCCCSTKFMLLRYANPDGPLTRDSDSKTIKIGDVELTIKLYADRYEIWYESERIMMFNNIGRRFDRRIGRYKFDIGDYGVSHPDKGLMQLGIEIYARVQPEALKLAGNEWNCRQ